MDDDDFSFGDDGGSDDDFPDDDQDNSGYDDDDQHQDQDNDEDTDQDSGDDSDNGNDEDDGVDDPDLYGSADDFPDAEEEDFEDDDGDWSADDYEESAERLFGDHEFFGDTLHSQLADYGFQPFEDTGFGRAFDQIAPGTSDTVHLFERDGRLWAFGFVSMAVLEMLRARYTGIDLSQLEVAVPGMGERVEPRPLPAEYANIQPADAVDLRKYASPVGDQRQTSRCSAFAWTHALELTRNVQFQTANLPRLAPNFTMLQFQRMQGDARDYEYAYEGGSGTVGGPEPGEVLAENGTCRQEMWPDDSPRPQISEAMLVGDARQNRLPGTPWPIGIDDVKKVLTAGTPVHVAINTGPAFSEVGRDGMVHVAEGPSGRHGRHAMLIVGYTGNFYIVKNSWGVDWGDRGYCLIPKTVLADSEPDFVAILRTRK